MDRMRSRRGHGESGQAMVEMAFVAPVILVILTGICSFGIAMNQYELLTYGTSSGARAFALSRNQSSWSPYYPLKVGTTTYTGDPCEYAYSVAAAAMPTLSTSNLTMNMTFTPPSGADNTAQTWNNVTSTSGCSTFSLDGTDINGTISITTNYPVYPLFWGWTKLEFNLTTTTAQQIE
ncbi:MAG TPA: TadE/TadG family type IV pilus assembly protein [Acidobacteriaceae bacterium]|nr:TadE/TadG family type IV pilus assembly protein [Acidobacteriaceae bacterium]